MAKVGSGANSHDVARHAGVARSTVSHILNNQTTRFSDETVERVRASAKELGYVPSAAGRTLVRGVSDFVVVLIPNATWGHDLQEIVDYISDYALELGLRVVARFQGADLASSGALVETIKPAAVITMFPLPPAARIAYRAAGALVVEMTTESGLQVNTVIGARQVEHFFERGHRRMAYAFLKNDREDVFGGERFVSASARAAQLGLAELDVIHIPLHPESARSALDSLDDEVSAILCFNDDVAIAVMAGARLAGRRVPHDLALLGVDGTSVGRLVSPALSSIRLEPRTFVNFVSQAFHDAGLDDRPRLGTPPETIYIVQGETS